MIPSQSDRPPFNPLTDTSPDYELSEATRHRLSQLMNELEQECIAMLKVEIRNSKLRRKQLEDDNNT